MVFNKLFCLFISVIPLVSSWNVSNGHIYNSKGQQTNIRGMSWFGFETPDFVVNGLGYHPLNWYIDLIKDNGINALRIPFSAEWILYNFDIKPYYGNVQADPSLQNKKSIEILDALFDYTEEKGILIMLDLHRLHKEYISELWYSPYDDVYTSDTYFSVWNTMLDRYGNRTNFFAVDLLNEPHGQATFGDNNPATDWRLFTQGAIQKFTKNYPKGKWLYFVEGIGWGKYLRGFQGQPYDLSPQLMSKVVFSPHNYGKSVVPGISMDPNSLNYDWNYNFGFLRDAGYTVVPGEWGGRTDIDSDWMNLFVEFLISKDIRSSFFWSLGPNSGDVAGYLLDDWTTVDQYKANIIAQLQPNPSD